MLLRRLLLPLIAIPLALFLGGSAVLEPVAESQLASALRATLGLRSRPAVEISAFPILLRLVQGRIPRVGIDARGATVEGLRIDRLDIDMEGVETSLGALLRRRRFDLTVERGAAVASITQDAINAFLARERADVTVALEPDGTVRVADEEVVAGRRRRFVATGRLTLRGRTLTFTPEAVTMDGRPVPAALRARARRETAFAVELPPLPAGIAPSQLAVSAGVIRLAADLEGFVLEVR